MSAGAYRKCTTIASIIVRLVGEGSARGLPFPARRQLHAGQASPLAWTSLLAGPARAPSATEFAPPTAGRTSQRVICCAMRLLRDQPRCVPCAFGQPRWHRRPGLQGFLSPDRLGMPRLRQHTRSLGSRCRHAPAWLQPRSRVVCVDRSPLGPLHSMQGASIQAIMEQGQMVPSHVTIGGLAP